MPLWTQQEPTDQDSKIMAMVGMVHRRVVDEKAPVRKQAVLLLEVPLPRISFPLLQLFLCRP